MTTQPKKPTYEQERDAATTNSSSSKYKRTPLYKQRYFQQGADWSRRYHYHDDKVIAELVRTAQCLGANLVMGNRDHIIGFTKDLSDALAKFEATKESLK